MTQNTSHAVMSQRKEPHDSLDYFPTPPWATRALCSWLAGAGQPLRNMSAWEPACGEGHIAVPLGEYFGDVISSDVHDYGWGSVDDFLFPAAAFGPVDWIITNPPFRLGLEFALTALQRARAGVALLVRTAFLESGERHARLFRPHPPSDIIQFCERVPMVKGRYDPEASTATSYCWLIWRLPLRGGDVEHTRFHWIAPCRTKFERPGDDEIGAMTAPVGSDVAPPCNAEPSLFGAAADAAPDSSARITARETEATNGEPEFQAAAGAADRSQRRDRDGDRAGGIHECGAELFPSLQSGGRPGGRVLVAGILIGGGLTEPRAGDTPAPSDVHPGLKHPREPAAASSPAADIDLSSGPASPIGAGSPFPDGAE